MAPFAGCFTRPTLAKLLILVAGAILPPGRRTVAAALSSVGLRGAPTFTPHRVLSYSRWSGQAAARCLLGLLVAAVVLNGPVVVGVKSRGLPETDETIERRWGARIRARGIPRDPVRSSHGHVAKASGLRWISLVLLAPVPFAGKVWALPFLTALAPSERYAQAQGRRHKPLTDRAWHLLLLLARWLPNRQVIAVADSSYAAIELLAAVRRHLTVITANSRGIARGCSSTLACSTHLRRAGPAPKGARASPAHASRRCSGAWPIRRQPCQLR